MNCASKVIPLPPDRRRIRGTPVDARHCRLRSRLRPKRQAAIIPLQLGRKRRVRRKEKWRERLRFLRATRGITFEQVANATGRTLRRVRGWERGYAMMYASDLAALAQLFGVSCDYVGGRSGDPRTAEEVLCHIGQPEKQGYPQMARLLTGAKEAICMDVMQILADKRSNITRKDRLYTLTGGDEYKAAEQKRVTARDRFEAMLTPEQQKVFLEWSDLDANRELYESDCTYRHGFLDGLSLAHDLVDHLRQDQSAKE